MKEKFVLGPISQRIIAEDSSKLLSIVSELNARLWTSVPIYPAELNLLHEVVRRLPWPTEDQKRRAVEDCRVFEVNLALGKIDDAIRSLIPLVHRTERLREFARLSRPNLNADLAQLDLFLGV